MTTTTLPTPPTVPHGSFRATAGKTNKFRDDSEEEERQEKRQLSLGIMSTRLDLGASHRSRDSAAVTRNKGSGKGPRISSVGDMKAHENVSGTSNDGRRETLASDGQNAETSKNRNPDTKKVDPAFDVLTPTAQEFLQAQGITSASNFVASNANQLAPAWAEWSGGALKTSKAKADVQCWKRKVRRQWFGSPTKKGATTLSHHVAGAELSQRPVFADAVAPTVEVFPSLELGAREFLLAQGITTAEVFLSTKSATITDALMDWRNQWDSSECSIDTARACIYKWKKMLREGQSSMPGQPIVELDAGLTNLSPMARQFLSSQGTATAKAFLSTNTTMLANAFMDWRKQWDSCECSISVARRRICSWKQKLRQLKSSMPGEPLVELDAALKTLSSMACEFLIAQGITTAEAFLSTKSAIIADALIDWRKQRDSTEYSISAAQSCICNWNKRLRQLQSSRQEAELNVLSPTGQSFLSTQSISTQSDLLRQGFKANAGPSNIPEWQQTELQEHTAGVETIHGALSHRVSATPTAVNAIPSDNESSLLLQPEEPPRLGTGNTGSQGIGSSGLNGTNQTHDTPDETTLDAATATPVSQVSVKTEQAGPPMWRKMRRKMATRTFPWTLPAAVNETVTNKATEDDTASNDSSSPHHGDSKGAEPRDDSNEQKPDSKRKQSQDESSPKKFRYSVFWV
jgi:hypothetical protein